LYTPGDRVQERKMTPEEILADLNSKNRDTLHALRDFQNLTRDEVLALMDGAAMRGFKHGTNVAMSMLQGALVVQLTRGSPREQDSSA
jgi:hypothetical protein